MDLFAGKTPTERNKIIAAAVLGLLALFALFMAFGPSFSSAKVSVTTKATPAPQASASPAGTASNFDLPTQQEQTFDYETTPIVYTGGDAYAPAAGRNIFAFYEPPPPTPYSPTPFAMVTPKPPTPTPTPPMTLAFVTPQSVYAGSGGFRLEVNGDKFTPDTHIYFNQSEFPTTYVNPQKLVADIPASMISSEGPKQVIVQTPDGKLYSNQMLLNVQAPPKPQFQYVGMIARKRYNNDTAYFQEQGKPTPFAARLNDVVGGRFRLVSISTSQAVVEDVSLGFKYALPISNPAPGSSGGSGNGGRNDGAADGFPMNPGMPTYNQQNIPGIPNNIPRYIPPQQPPQQQPPKKDVDDNDPNDDGDN
jgi:hypothetical protein